MTAKRFTHKINQLGMQFICYDDKAELLGTFADAEGVTHIVKLLNELHEENQKQKTTIRMLEQQSQRQINRNERLHKDWDKLYQHLLDMGLMTDEEILKVI